MARESVVKARTDKVDYKLGANRTEEAARPRKHHANFKQSRDVREDRGERQIKMGAAKCSVRR